MIVNAKPMTNDREPLYLITGMSTLYDDRIEFWENMTGATTTIYADRRAKAVNYKGKIIFECSDFETTDDPQATPRRGWLRQLWQDFNRYNGWYPQSV